ncbi:hypothetical protein HDU93_005527, partial [Gonapodya sp. JEL0774]
MEESILAIERVIKSKGGALTIKMNPRAVSETDDKELEKLMEKAEQETKQVGSKVVGVLLGVRSEDGAEVDIRNAFAVPFKESSGTLDKEFFEDVYTLHRRVNAREVPVGWEIFAHDTGGVVPSSRAKLQNDNDTLGVAFRLEQEKRNSGCSVAK